MAGFVKAGFSIFANVCLLPLPKKTGLLDFSEKQAPNKAKYLLPGGTGGETLTAVCRLFN